MVLGGLWTMCWLRRGISRLAGGICCLPASCFTGSGAWSAAAPSRIISCFFWPRAFSFNAAVDRQKSENMLDIQQLRTNLDAVAEGLAKRGKPIDFSEFVVLETERKTLQSPRAGFAGAA